METGLADRVALLAWRLRRVSRFEAGVVARASDKAARRARGEETEPSDGFSLFARTQRPVHQLVEARERVERAEQSLADGERLAPLLASLSTATGDVRIAGADALFVLSTLVNYLPELDDDEDDEEEYDDEDEPYSDPMTDPLHPRFLLAVGVPAEAHDQPHQWCGWTAGAVRLGVERIARTEKWTADHLLARTPAGIADLTDERTELIAARRELAGPNSRHPWMRPKLGGGRWCRQRRRYDGVLRYEGHLQRQLTQTLHELERRQALRSDTPPQPPAALDVIRRECTWKVRLHTRHPHGLNEN